MKIKIRPTEIAQKSRSQQILILSGVRNAELTTLGYNTLSVESRESLQSAVHCF